MMLMLIIRFLCIVNVVCFVATGEEVDEFERKNGINKSDFNFNFPLSVSNSSWEPESSVGIYHHRAKRAVTFTNFNFEMTEVLKRPSSLSEFEYGDNIVFNVQMDFPEVAPADKFDLNLEIFELEQTNGIGGFTMCRVHQASKGANLVSNPGTPEVAETPHETYTNIIEKAIVPFKEIETNGADRSAQVQFEAMMVNIGDVSGGQNRHITAGLEYGDSAYIWVGQASVSTKATLKTMEEFPLKVEYTDGDIPTELAKGDSTVIQLTMYVTNPSSSIKFEAFQPNGYDDVLHVGQITTQWGPNGEFETSGFSCSDISLLEYAEEQSPSGLSNTKRTITHPFLLNHDGSRSTSDDANKIVVNIPVHAMNLPQVFTEVKRDIAISLYIGDSKMWAGYQEFTIKEAAASAPATNDVSITDVRLLNKEPMRKGDGATYRITVTVPVGWSNFDVEIEGDADYPPGNVKIVNTGTVAYFPPRHTVDEVNGNVLKVNFGNVKNAAKSDDTNVTLDVTFNIKAAVTLADGDLKAKVGTKDATLPGFTAVEPVPESSIAVVAKNFGIDTKLSNKLYEGGQVSLDLEVTVPVSSGAKELYFEGVPDFDITTFGARLCRLKISKVGKNLNCMESRSEKVGSPVVSFYNKTESIREFNDYGAIHLGEACPIETEGQEDEDNKFIANLAFEMPPQVAIEDNKAMKLHGGIRVADQTIWAASNTYTIQKKQFVNAGGSPEAVVSGASPEVIVPFVTDYPDVTVKDLGNIVNFQRKDGFFIKYIFKTPPQTFGKYIFTVNLDDTTNKYFKVCRLLLLQIGDNYPCTEPMPASPTGYETTILTYGKDGEYHPSDNTEPKAGQSANYEFMGLANWGRDSMVADLIPDADSIQLVAFVQVTGVPTTGQDIPLKYRLQAGNTNYDGETLIQLSTGDRRADGKIEDSNGGKLEWEYAGDAPFDTSDLFTKASKLIRIKLTIPNGFQNVMVVEIKNKDFASDKHVEFCYATVVKSGNNIPCVDPELVSTKWFGQKEYEGEIVYEKIDLSFPQLCKMHTYSAKPEDSEITIEVAVRGKSFVPDGTDITLQVEAMSHAGDPDWPDTKKDIPLKVNYNTASITESTIDSSDIKIHLDVDGLSSNGGLHTMKVHRSAWLKYYVQIPPETISQVKLTAMAPSDDKEALFHINDIRFGYAGKNILCVSCFSNDKCATQTSIDSDGYRSNMKKAYDTEFIKSENITAFMTKDVVQADLGFVTNAGFTKKWGNHQEEDDRFAVEVEVISSDSAPLAHDRIFGVHLAATVGGTTVIGTQNIKIERDSTGDTDKRKTQERGNIIAEVQNTDTSVEKTAGEKLNISLIIYHDYTNSSTRSMAEGKTTKIRIIGPKYLDYVDGSDEFTTNYTLDGTAKNGVTFVKGPQIDNKLGGVPTDIQFENGIKFADFISISFTMTVDKDKIRPVGSGNQDTAALFHPLCIQNVFESYPADNDTTFVSCGSFTNRSFTSKSDEIHDLIPKDSNGQLLECQVHASSMMKYDSRPHEAMAATDTEKRAWQPALRTGKGWNEYLVFDFFVNARITKLKVGKIPGSKINDTDVRQIDTVDIMASNVAGNYYPVALGKRTDTSDEIIFDSAFTARFVKVIIKPESSRSADASPIAVNQVKWFGSHPPTTGKTCADASKELWDGSKSKITRDSTSRTQYRHYAYDSTHDIIYFCDLNPYKEGMFCYCSDRNEPGNVWNEMPRYIDHIWGHSEKTGRMYFRDSSGKALISSLDCKHFELTDEDEDVNCQNSNYCADNLKNDGDNGLARNVPGFSMTGFPDDTFPGSNIKAKFDGLYEDNKMVVKWRACCEPS